MTPFGLLKPWYVFRPGQVVRRLARSIRPPRQPVQVVTLPWGCPVEVDIGETIGRSLWTAGVYDLAVSEILWRLADPGLLAIDAGANIGSFTGLLAARAAEVWAFEPLPKIVRRLEGNVARFAGLPGFAPCRVFPLALSDADGEAAMGCPDGFDRNQGTARLLGPGGEGVRVATARLDHLLGDRAVGVLKLDVEGHELAVLRGAAGAVAAGRIRNIVFEDHDGVESPVCGFLQERGYEIYGIGWGMFGPRLEAQGGQANRPYEAPSYLATRDRAAATACGVKGWRCLRGRG